MRFRNNEKIKTFANFCTLEIFSLQINKLRPVFEMTTSQCSREMRFLICSSLFPWCSDEISRPVLACRSVCEKVKSDCAQDPIMKYWPSFLECEQLPQNEKQELCMTVSWMIDDESLCNYNNEFYLFRRCPMRSWFKKTPQRWAAKTQRNHRPTTTTTKPISRNITSTVSRRRHSGGNWHNPITCTTKSRHSRRARKISPSTSAARAHTNAAAMRSIRHIKRRSSRRAFWCSQWSASFLRCSRWLLFGPNRPGLSSRNDPFCSSRSATIC